LIATAQSLAGGPSLRDGTWDGRRVVYEEPKFVYIRVGRSPVRVAGLAENRRLEWRGGISRVYPQKWDISAAQFLIFYTA